MTLFLSALLSLVVSSTGYADELGHHYVEALEAELATCGEIAPVLALAKESVGADLSPSERSDLQTFRTSGIGRHSSSPLGNRCSGMAVGLLDLNSSDVHPEISSKVKKCADNYDTFKTIDVLFNDNGQKDLTIFFEQRRLQPIHDDPDSSVMGAFCAAMVDGNILSIKYRFQNLALNESSSGIALGISSVIGIVVKVITEELDNGVTTMVVDPKNDKTHSKKPVDDGFRDPNTHP